METSYFGDSDIFAKETGLSDSGRDSTAFSLNDCTAFVMDLKILGIIKQNYSEIYKQMQTVGVFRHKKH